MSGFWPTFLRYASFGLLNNPDRGVQRSGSETRYTESDISLTDERAMGLSAAWACVRLLTQTGGTLPLPLFSKDDDGNRSYVPRTDPIARLLHHPNQYMNGKEFRQAMWTQRVLWGNAYAKIGRNVVGTPVALLPLVPAAVTVSRHADGTRYDYTTATGSEVYWNRPNQPAQMFHWRGFSPDGVMGLSPLGYARHAMGISISADRAAAKAFVGRPNGVLQSDTILTPDQRTKLRELYSNIGGAEIGNAQWWLLEGGFKYQAIGMPPDDLQMLESRQFQVAEICRFYGVPTVMVDGNAGATGAWPASYEQQVLSFLTFTLKPYLEEFEEKVMEVLTGPDLYAEHNVEGLLRADSKTRAMFYATSLQNGWMNRNEVRRRENLPTVDGLDDYTIQVNLTPADKLGETHDSQQTSPAAG